MRPVGWHLAPALVMATTTLLIACHGGGDKESKPRLVATVSVDGTEVKLEATLTCQHFSAGMTPNMDFRGTHDACASDVRPAATRGGKALALAIDRGKPQEVVRNVKEAQVGFRAMTVDACGGGGRVVWRARDPVDSAARGWEIGLLLPSHVIHAALASTAATCVEALAAAPTVEEWIATGATASDTCRALDEEGRPRDALRCTLQTSAFTGQQQRFEALGKKYVDGVRSGVMEGDLFAVLAVDSKQDARQWGSYDVEMALKAAPSLPKKRALIADTLDTCAKRDLRTPCGSWRTEAMWTMVDTLHDAALCDQGLARAEALLAQPGQLPAAQALQVVPHLCACAPSPGRLAALMRAGLARPTTEDVPLPSDDFRTYTGAPDGEGECTPQSMKMPAGDKRCRPLCPSFPRFAGTWLADHCDPAGVEAATKALATRPTRDPRVDAVVDGAFRVLGACAPASLDAELPRVPRGADPKTLREMLVKDGGG